MTVKEIADALGMEVYSGAANLGAEVTGGYASDLLSDVMGHAKEGQLWITLQTHMNVVGVASLKELAAIVLVKGLKPLPETVEAAEREGVPILGSGMQAFELCGRLFQILA